eukprot:XP_014774982.1 PREDICTED: uncharacterized protein LOC106872484 [Octopus bimaculoides]
MSSNTKSFPNSQKNYQNHNWLCERAILAPKNVAVKKINQQLMHSLPGALHPYKSVDTIPDKNEVVNYPPEFLNSLEPPGLRPHILALKVGTPVMLLRNLEPPRLCNGTRLVIKKMMSKVIESILLSGCGKNDDVFIPRIPLTPPGAEIPFTFRRLQFPLRVTFAMSINKSQGQTLSVAGLLLEEPCFSHRQLYVGCLRVGKACNPFVGPDQGKSLKVFLPFPPDTICRRFKSYSDVFIISFQLEF